MEKMTGIFAGKDPFEIARRWLNDAREKEVNDPDAMALATVDSAGLPNVRMVLLKEIEPDAFVFYTNYDSVKAREIAQNGKAAFVMHWKSLRRQLRVRGVIEKENGIKADAYFASRSPQSRVGAWASHQSMPLESRKKLLARAAAITLAHGPTPSRPPFWGGYRIFPQEIEFWADGAFRLHDRFRWSRQKGEKRWTIKRLHP